MKNFSKYYFFLFFLFVFLISFTIIKNSYGQITIDETKSETSITSYFDGLFKAPLLISQAFVVGISFIHSFLFIRMIKTKHILLDNENNNLNFFLSFLFDNKLFLIIIVVSGSIILCMSIILLIFQAYTLSFDLGLDLPSTIGILLSSSVGNIFITKLITAILIIIIGILNYYISKRFQKQYLTITKINKFDQGLLEQNYYKKNLKNQKVSLAFCMTIVVFGSINILSNSIQSHNAAVNFFPIVAISADWLHFMMVSIWVGGLFYISLILSRKLVIKDNISPDHNYIQSSIRNSKDFASIHFILLTILRFSLIAIVSLSVIFLTGLYMAILHLQQPSSLINSIYGNILTLKLLIVFAMASLGGYHYLQIPRLIKKINKKPLLNQLQYLKKFNKTLKVEYILGISIIFISSFLTITNPPHHESHNMNIQMMDRPKNTITQNISNIGNQWNNPLNQAFPLIAFIISILIIILMILFLKQSWTNLKLYKKENII